MPEWLSERGIGETRFALVDGANIIEARVLLDGIDAAGTRLPAQVRRRGGQWLAMAQDEEFLLPGGPDGKTDGAGTMIEVLRERIPGAEPWKRPLARVADGLDGPPLVPLGLDLPLAGRNALDEAGWDDLLDEARSGIVGFDGGELRLSATPAMTLIDVDGRLEAESLALRAANAAAQVIRRLGIGGSIGIDFPTLAGKAARAAVGAVIDAALPPPFERTALNGFGFLQIVRPRRHASLLELAQDRPGFEARALLRRAGKDRTGATCLVAHPAVIALLERRPEWLEMLARQVGGAVTLRADPSLAISAGHAEP